jgi:reactive intermediate/imine deaminase
MTKIVVQTKKAPSGAGPYSLAIRAGNTIYLSGQIPLDPVTMTLSGDDFATQARQVFKNLQAVADEAGGGLEAVVRLNVYLTNLADFQLLNEVMKEFFIEPYPARTTVQVAALPKEAKIEVDAIMVV